MRDLYSRTHIRSAYLPPVNTPIYRHHTALLHTIYEVVYELARLPHLHSLEKGYWSVEKAVGQLGTYTLVIQSLCWN